MQQVKKVWQQHKMVTIISGFIFLAFVGFVSYMVITAQGNNLVHIKQEYDAFKQQQEVYKEYCTEMQCDDEQDYLNAVQNQHDGNAKIYFERYKECVIQYITNKFAKVQTNLKEKYKKLDIIIDDYKNDSDKEKINDLKFEIEKILIKQKEVIIFEDIELLKQKINELEQFINNAEKSSFK